MPMLKNKKCFYIAVVVILAALAFYLYSAGKLPGYRNEDTSGVMSESSVVFAREISVETTYPVPGKEDVERYTMFLDEDGLIVDFKAEGVFDSSLNKKLGEFSEGLLLVIKGKKLSDLEEVDKIGTSTLTTDAFNASLSEFKSQL